LTGRGTTSLSVVGRPVTLDLSALGPFAQGPTDVDGVAVDLTQTPVVQLMPGQHYVYVQGVVTYFTVNADGTVDYDAALEGALTGRGTTSLSLVGLPVTLDLSALGQLAQSPTDVDGVGVDLTQTPVVQLMPGQHYVYVNGVVTYFTVNADGTLDYDHALDGTLSGRGTSTLVFLAT
jgi:hypothetical protein